MTLRQVKYPVLLPSGNGNSETTLHLA